MTTPGRAVGLALALALAPASVSGQGRDPVSAADRYDRGVRLASEGDLRGALVEFRAAFEATQNPEVLFNIAAAHEQLNEYVEAEDALLRYERLCPPAAFERHRAEVVAAHGRLNARIGVVRVRTSTPSIACSLDGAPRPTAELIAGVRASVGRRELRCQAEGHEPVTLQVEVRGGDVTEVEVAPTRRRASLTVACAVEGAEVRVDGRVVGRTPLREPLVVEEGRHRVEVLRPGYEPAVGEVEARGVGARFEATLRWLDPVPAREGAWLVVRASQPGASSTLDGRRHVPDGSVVVPPGRHRLRVERPDFVAAERVVDLGLGERQVLDVRLDPTPATRAQYLRDARSSRTRWIALVVGGAAAAGAGALWFGLTLPSYLDANERHDENRRLFDGCGVVRVCAPGESTGYAEARDAAAEESGGLLPQVWASGAVMALGVGALVTGIVLALDAPRSDRFDRPPTWHIGAAPNGLRILF